MPAVEVLLSHERLELGLRFELGSGPGFEIGCRGRRVLRQRYCSTQKNPEALHVRLRLNKAKAILVYTYPTQQPTFQETSTIVDYASPKTHSNGLANNNMQHIRIGCQDIV